VDAFEVAEPVEDSPVLVEIPHAGLALDAPTMNWLVAPTRCIAREADLYVDELYADATRLGATVLRANLSRFAVDLNRASDDFDGQTVEGGSTADRPRGVVWRLTSEGFQVQRERMPRAELERRLEQYWRPYHKTLASLLERKRKRFGGAVLLCAHSMPTPKPRGLRAFVPNNLADVVPGTRGRTSARGQFIDEVDRVARAHGLAVEHDVPYRGGFSTMNYGRPDLNVHAIQVEVARRLYMDEDTLILDCAGRERMRRFAADLVNRLVTSARGVYRTKAGSDRDDP
jgi:N-formylglutamate deformylase